MISEHMMALGKKRSVIREIFEYGNKRKAEIGADKVYDFSLGNPSIPAPDCVNECIKELVDSVDCVTLHGYTSATGDPGVRKAICDSINESFGLSLTPDCIYMTSGAAASLTISLSALFVEGDEAISFIPFFPEYRVFSEAAGYKLVPVETEDLTFQIDIDKFEKSITEHTKCVILNSPNNPSGVVTSEETIIKLCTVLKKYEEKYGHPIYLISDEPYRELVYDDIKVPYLMNYYDDTIVCYSFSKSLSLPGERIGYIAVSNRMKDYGDVYAAVCGAGRALGYVCASSMYQRVAAKCLGKTADISAYKKNRDILYEGLVKAGFKCVHPDGAFYLFVKSPEPDAYAFCERAKEYELLLVPADDFGTKGYVRISYCVTEQMIRASLPAFEKLANSYK